MSSRWTRRSCTRRTPPDAEMLFNTTRHALRTFLAYGTVFGFSSTEAICLSPRNRVRVRLARRCRSILGSRSHRIHLSLPRACEALTPIVNGSSHALFAPPPTPPSWVWYLRGSHSPIVLGSPSRRIWLTLP